MSLTMNLLGDATASWQAVVSGTIVGAACATAASRIQRFLSKPPPVAQARGRFCVAAGTIIETDQAICQMLGRTRGEVLGHGINEIFGFNVLPPDGASLVARLREPMRILLRHPSGNAVPAEIGMDGAVASGVGRTFLTLRALSARRGAVGNRRQPATPARVAALPHEQALTDRLSDTLVVARSHRARVMLCLVGIDSVGPGPLVEGSVAHKLWTTALTRITACVRAADTLSHLEGNLFGVIQMLTSHSITPASLARRLLAELSAPCVIDGMEVALGVAIGVALSPNHGETADALITSTRTALAAARLGSHDRYCIFDDTMGAQAPRERCLADDLRQAIEDNALMLYYQPLCDGDTLEVCGYEALLRWAHPTLGNIEPALFVPLAEETGMIHQLGRWVIETACQAAASWPSKQFVAVNLSPVQMRQKGLTELVASTLLATGLEPWRLELEVTESVMMEDIDRVALTFRTLRESGVHLALDDFGTGYSSLSHLRCFPFDRVKIDRSFIQALGEDDSANKIVWLIVNLGHSLGMQVTAEGVETEAQLRTLQEYRCSTVQGYLIGRPVPRRTTEEAHYALLARCLTGSGDGSSGPATAVQRTGLPAVI